MRACDKVSICRIIQGPVRISRAATVCNTTYTCHLGELTEIASRSVLGD